MTRWVLRVLAVSAMAAISAMAACAPTVPDSGAGVGFDRIDAERRARDAQLTGGLPDTVSVSSTPLTPAPAAARAAQQANSGQAPLNADPSNPAPAIRAGNPGISDENDFEAVSGRQSIESDAARIQANAAQYTVIQPTALPSRSGAASGPNVVQYALKTSNPLGNRIYSRSGFNAEARFLRNCAVYRTPDEAQAEFLALGGPARDRKGLDPDGDGYACNWDPAPFRAAVSR